MKTLLIIFTLVFNAATAIANDSSAGIAAGGLELLKSEDISMESEELTISSKLIKVTYVFKNNSTRDIETLVAFPLAKLPSDEVRDIENVNIPNEHSENFVNFKVKVENVDIPVHIDHKAFIGKENTTQKQDITADLKQYTVPLSPFSNNYQQRLNTLPADIKSTFLAKQWLVEENHAADEPAKNVLGTWETQTTLYWTQVFPRNKTIRISHEYNPAVSSGVPMGFDDINNYINDKKQFCIDKATEKAIGKRSLSWSIVQYILITANNWQGPIKNFKLILDKEDAKNVISVCLPEIKKINSTQFALEYKNFIPKKDLDILILKPYSD